MKMTCVRCEKTFDATYAAKYCPFCAEDHKKERYRIRVDKKREKEGKAKLNRCVRCGNPRGEGKYYCQTCAELHEAEERRKLNRSMPQRDKDILDLLRPLPSQRPEHFSAAFTGDEIDRLAKHFHTSYGKMRAWMDCHNRLPKEGERMF